MQGAQLPPALVIFRVAVRDLRMQNYRPDPRTGMQYIYIVHEQIGETAMGAQVRRRLRVGGSGQSSAARYCG